MGQSAEAKCLKCGHGFIVTEGGGFFFHQLRCEKCGDTKNIGFDKLGETNQRYIKDLPVPHSFASSEKDLAKQGNPHIESLTVKEYYERVEAYAGTCECGGKFTFNARPRCPNCRSIQIKIGKVIIFYD